MLWIERSAFRHGVLEDEIIHALTHPLKHFELVVIHAMKARKDFFR